MDTFYKPPMQRATECKALEDNYMNCLFQKSLKDKVIVNRCVLDSVLWFHLECPRAASKFDDPVEFKKKFRDFFASNKSIAEASRYRSDTTKRVKKAYGFQSSYPEDLTYVKKVQKFADEFEKFSPSQMPVDLDEEDPDEDTGLNAPVANSEVLYGKKLEYLQSNPIDLLESKAGREELFRASDKPE